MLKRLTPKHREIMRRLVVGESPKDIAKALSLKAATIRKLEASDPLFRSELQEFEFAARERVLASEDRISVMSQLENLAHKAVDFCEGVIDGTVPEVSPKLRLDSAWDVLDRTDNKPSDRGSVGIATAADLIIAAYETKHKNDKPELVNVTPGGY